MINFLPYDFDILYLRKIVLMKNILTDWQFWSLVVAFVALLLSQFPPVFQIFRRGKLIIDLPRNFTIDHKVGKPIIYLYLTLKNIGGRDVNVKSIEIDITEKKRSFKILGNSYLESSTDNIYTVLSPFSLKAGETWSHSVFFEEWWSRKLNRKYKILEARIRKEITSQLNKQLTGVTERKKAKKADVDDLIKFMTSQYKWEDGEYDLTVSILGENKKILAIKTIQFILYESDAGELLSHSEEYIYGAGVYFIDQHRPLVIIDIPENNLEKSGSF